MNRPFPMMFALQELSADLSKIGRNHRILGTDRPESDVEHSYTVALLCWYVHDQLKLSLDLSKIFKYALVHDAPERYAGDINTYASKSDRQKKIKLEAEATKKLLTEFKDFPDLAAALKSYEAMTDEEAVFVWTVDKMQALILGDLDNWVPYQRINISYETFSNKHREQLSDCSYHCKDIFETLSEYCKTTFYDQPSK